MYIELLGEVIVESYPSALHLLPWTVLLHRGSVRAVLPRPDLQSIACE